MKISKASDDMDDHRDKPIVHYIKVETGVNKDDLSQTSHSTRNADPSSDTDCINALLLPPNGTCCHIEAGIASRPPLHQGRHHFEATTALRRQTASLH